MSTGKKLEEEEKGFVEKLVFSAKKKVQKITGKVDQQTYEASVKTFHELVRQVTEAISQLEKDGVDCGELPKRVAIAGTVILQAEEEA